MQAFRLVKGGAPDRVIAFDELPAEFLRNLQTNPPSGLARHWSRWLEENGSVDKNGRPAFYIVDYVMVNNDREAWQNISQYVRRAVETRVRLMDRLEDMAVPMAKDSRTEMSLEPEDVPIIPVPKNEKVESQPEPEPIAVERPKRGRRALVKEA